VLNVFLRAKREKSQKSKVKSQNLCVAAPPREKNLKNLCENSASLVLCGKKSKS
jgi:hypothetical protein